MQVCLLFVDPHLYQDTRVQLVADFDRLLVVHVHLCVEAVFLVFLLLEWLLHEAVHNILDLLYLVCVDCFLLRLGLLHVGVYTILDSQGLAQ